MRILLTGATGFLGKHLLKKIIENKYECCILSRNTKRIKKNIDSVINVINYHNGKLDYVEEISTFNPEIVIHLAGYLTSADDYNSIERLLESNIEFTSKLCFAIQKTNVRFFFNTGSSTEYYYGDGNPEPAYFYSATKIAARHIIEYFSRKNKFEVVHVLPYTIYGPNRTDKKVIDYIIDSVVMGKHSDMTDGEQVLDFIHVDDVVDFYIHLIKEQKKIKPSISEYHLGTGIGTSIKELAKMVEEVTGKKGDFHWGEIPYRHRDIFHSIAPISRIKKEFGWEPKIHLKDGLKSLLDLRKVKDYE